MRTARMRRGFSRPKGGILVLAALMMVPLIGAVGLAVDAGRGYGVKAKLNAAVDAASIAAARALVEGADDAARIANARATGTRFFNANFPDGYLGATPRLGSIDAVHNLADGRWTVTVRATADMPTTFMRVLGQNQVDVSAMGQTVRRDLDVMLVLDSSGSIGSAMPTLKNAAINGFVDKFTPGAGGDRIGVVSYSSGAYVNVEINKTIARGFDRTRVVNAINGLSSSGWTTSGEAMRQAVMEMRAVPASVRSSLRVILLFSDGAPNTISADLTGFGKRTLASDTGGSGTGRADASYRWTPPNDSSTQLSVSLGSANPATIPASSLSDVPPNLTSGGHAALSIPFANYRAGRRTMGGPPYANTRCNVNMAARNMLENAANLARSDGIVVYTIGLGPILNSVETSFSGSNCGYTSAQERGSVLLQRAANVNRQEDANQPAGLYCFANSSADLQRCFETIASEILRLSQ